MTYVLDLVPYPIIRPSSLVLRPLGKPFGDGQSIRFGQGDQVFDVYPLIGCVSVSSPRTEDNHRRRAVKVEYEPVAGEGGWYVRRWPAGHRFQVSCQELKDWVVLRHSAARQEARSRLPSRGYPL